MEETAGFFVGEVDKKRKTAAEKARLALASKKQDLQNKRKIAITTT